MKVSLFIHSFRGGGAEKMMVTIGNELQHRGYSIELVLVNSSGPYKSRVDPSIPVIEVGGENTLEIQYNLWKHLRSSNSEVLLSTMEIPNIVSVVATRWPNSIPVILRVANINSMKNRHGRYRLIPFLKRLTYQRAEAIVTISDGVAVDLSKVTGINRQEMKTIYNPAYNSEISKKSCQPVDHTWLDDEKRVVIGVGNMKPQKNFSTLLRAVGYLQLWKDTHLIILGKGDLRDELIQQATNLGIRKRVSFPGFVDNPYAYMAKADVFVLSSAWEGFGNVIVEAMACGTPVVCTDCPGGPAEILDNGEYGPLVPVGDEKSMAEAIKKMLENPTESDVLISRAKDFMMEKIVDQYEDVLLSVAKDNK